jgi:hypothetical protein
MHHRRLVSCGGRGFAASADGKTCRAPTTEKGKERMKEKPPNQAAFRPREIGVCRLVGVCDDYDYDADDDGSSRNNNSTREPIQQ